jgi:putative transposase
MKRSRFAETQIVSIKQAHNGRIVKELCREHGLLEATHHSWKSK